MAQTLDVIAEGGQSTFAAARLRRSSLYGARRRLPVDAQGRECRTAALTRDGHYILPAGGAATLYLDEAGDGVERQDLQAVGQAVSLFDAEAHTVAAADPSELLDHVVTHVYVLDPVSVAPALDAALGAGAILRLQATGERADRAAFLVKNDGGFFLLLGRPSRFDWIASAHADRSPPEDDVVDGDWETMDFSMM